jgi:hypothetical protein
MFSRRGECYHEYQLYIQPTYKLKAQEAERARHRPGMGPLAGSSRWGTTRVIDRVESE